MSKLSSIQKEAANAKKTITSALIVNEHGEFLAMLRAGDKSYGNTWGIPGGKKKEGESFADSVRREINEETGLLAASLLPLMITNTDRRVFYDYIAFARKSQVTMNDEHTSYQWISSLDEWPSPAHPVTAELIQARRLQIMAFVTNTTNRQNMNFNFKGD